MIQASLPQNRGRRLMRYLTLNRRAMTLQVALVVCAVALAGASGEDQTAALDRLRSMPLSEREALAEQLTRFSSLPRPERQAIRTLDAELRELPDEVRARYLRVLNRYHVWLKSIPEPEREKIAATPVESRVEMVRDGLKMYPLSSPSRIDNLLARTSLVNPSSLFDQAHWIRIWLSLDESQKGEITKVAAKDRITQLEELGNTLGIDDPRPEILRRLEQDVRGRFGEAGKRGQGLGKMMQSLKGQPNREILQRGVEARFLQSFRPEPVLPDDQERFYRALPAWIQGMFTPLPPTAARERLKLLYRLVYPAPLEISTQIGDADTAAPQPPANAPTPRPSEPASPSVPF